MNKVIIIILSIVLITGIGCTKKPLPQTEQTTNASNKFPYPMYIGVQKGLNLRSGPDIKSQVILVIPYREQVLVTKEAEQNVVIDNITGKWVNVKWRDKTGWLFNGYLDINICDNPSIFRLYNIIPYKPEKLSEIVHKHHPNENRFEKPELAADINMFNEKPRYKPGDNILIINQNGISEDTVKNIYFTYIFGTDLLLRFNVSKNQDFCNKNQCVYIKKSEFNDPPIQVNNIGLISDNKIKNKIIEKVYEQIFKDDKIISGMIGYLREIRSDPENEKINFKKVINKDFKVTVKTINSNNLSKNFYLIEFKNLTGPKDARFYNFSAVIINNKIVFLNFSRFIASFKLGDKNYFFFSTWRPHTGAGGNVLYSIKDNKWALETSDFTFAN